jgi:alpha-galactosidase
MPGRLTVILATIAAALLISFDTLQAGDTLILSGDAFVQSDDQGWTIGNPLIRYAIGGSGEVGVRAIADPSTGRSWEMSEGPDSFISVNGERLLIGGSRTDLEGADVSEWRGGVRLDVHYRVRSASLVMTRTYAAYPGSPVIETWTSLRQEGSRASTLSDLNAYALSVPNGTLNWLTGLHGAPDSAPFSRASGDMDDGQVFELGSDTRASEQAVPWYAIDAEGAEFFGSILWSGAWRVRLERHGDAIAVQAGLPPFHTTLAPGASLELPHAVFGFTTPALPRPSLALRAFIDQGVRNGRPIEAYVTYNTWYSYGTFIDDGSMRAEMDLAASLGVEQFVVDAGWWFGINPDDAGDFRTNWGRWDVDTNRFPDGLGALSDYAHTLNMRFGVWVEPERVAMTAVGGPGLARERYLATVNGRYDPAVPNGQAQSAQVCLVDPDARAWILSRLVDFISEVHPDYLKWDNNFWINCNRSGHGHGIEDANFLHHQALDGVLDWLRDAFPWLQIEICASGGNRLSLGALARSDVAWVDDRTGPAPHVRHVLEGLFDLFPAPFLLAFSTNPVETSVDGVTDGPGYVLRSRMLGAFGVSWPLSGLDEPGQAEVRGAVELYKWIRPALQQGVPILLTPQSADSAAPGWDAVQYLVPSTTDSVVVAFGTAESGPAVVQLRALQPERQYTVQSADAGWIAERTGAALMTDGIAVQAGDVSAGHVIVVHAD